MAVDIRCIRCGYNQRGLDREGACPECGNPVANTLARTPGSRHAAEAVLESAQMYGASHRATMAFGLVPFAASVGCCLIFGIVGTVIVLCGCATRLAALLLMKRNHATTVPGNAHAFRSAVLAACIETAMGLLFISTVTCGLATFLPSPLDEYIPGFLALGWATAVCLGIVSSALLADALALQYSLDVDRSRLPLLLSFIPPCIMVLALGLALVPAWNGVRAVAIVSGVLSVAAALTWIAAGAAASAYITGIVTVLGFTPAKVATPTGDQRVAEPVTEAHTSPEERAAARKIRDDDSPIPLD